MKIRMFILIGVFAIFLISFITGCTTVNEKSLEENSMQPVTRKDLMELQYSIDHDACIIYYNKCMVEKKKKCWEKHERCVINTYRMYRPQVK